MRTAELSIWGDVGVHMLADTLLLVALLIVGAAFHWLTRRRSMRGFFGVPKRGTVRIYLSSLHITQGGSVGIDGRPRSYSGYAVAFSEVKVAELLQDVFRHPLPFVADPPE